ncbi:B-cell receptor-associated 31-like protein [Metschnikowia bicuspidata]|uniref:Endoplasmic reticulum transmembrane protein n=1 Tax=Metschnikowia bicuspidata TaxID=27322 RepID=A0A4P9ZJ25_9ASCO|nr:B-cell receptor-associated 31-like protein [Metschnikowia bicuspidata]
MAFFAILSLPFPRALRKTVLTSVSAPFQSEQFQIALKCIFGFVLVLFIDSVNRVYSVTAELQSFSLNGMSALNLLNDRAEVQSRRFYAQRNMYLCGFALFLTLILIRTYSLVAELIQTKDKLDLIKKEDAAPDLEEIAALRLELEEKSAQLETLKEQAAALSNEFDSVSSVKSRKTN